MPNKLISKSRYLVRKHTFYPWCPWLLALGNKKVGPPITIQKRFLPLIIFSTISCFIFFSLSLSICFSVFLYNIVPSSAIFLSSASGLPQILSFSLKIHPYKHKCQGIISKIYQLLNAFYMPCTVLIFLYVFIYFILKTFL